MSDTVQVTTATPRSKAKVSPSASHFESAFSTATFETPAALREFAEKGLSQAKEGYEKMKSAAEEATSLIESTCTSATKGAADYGLKLIEIGRANSNAAFDYATSLLGAKSASEVVELSTAHARKHFETLSAQAHELAALAQKIATDTAEPLKDGMTRMVKKVG
jgi:phasin